MNVEVIHEPPQQPSIESGFRQRLRQWEKEHAEAYVMTPAPKESNLRRGDVLNNTTRPQPGLFQIEGEEDDFEDFNMAKPIFDRGELVDVGSKRTFLLPGDLVELLYVI
jgi:hypothetical protein